MKNITNVNIPSIFKLKNEQFQLNLEGKTTSKYYDYSLSSKIIEGSICTFKKKNL